MKSIDLIIAEAAQEIYPSVNTLTFSYPMLELQKATVSSSVCQLVAEQLKVNPEEIASRIIPTLRQKGLDSVEFCQGFINVKIPADKTELLKIPSVLTHKRINIFIAPYSRNLQANEYIRFLAQALLQIWILKYLNVEVACWLGDNNISENVRIELLDYFKEKLSEARAGNLEAIEHDLIEQEVQAFNHKSLVEPKIIWLAPRTLTKKSFNQLCRNIQESSTIICCPAQNRLVGVEFEFGLLNNKQSLLDLLILLASPDSGSDLDCYLASSNENANLAWFARNTISRIKQYCHSQSNDLSLTAGDYQDLPVELQQIIIKNAQLERINYCSGIHGDVLTWFIALNQFLMLNNKVFNSPSTRQSLEKNEMHLPVYKVLANSYRNLSEMNGLWSVV